MKRTLLSLILVCFAIPLQAQGDEYDKAITAAVITLDAFGVDLDNVSEPERVLIMKSFITCTLSGHIVECELNEARLRTLDACMMAAILPPLLRSAATSRGVSGMNSEAVCRDHRVHAVMLNRNLLVRVYDHEGNLLDTHEKDYR